MTKQFFTYAVVIVFSLLFTVSNKTIYLICSVKIVNLKFAPLGTSHHLSIITNMGREGGGKHTVTIITSNEEGSLEY